MVEERSLADRLLDYGVYAPIGIALSVVEELPKLADKGRQRAAGQVHVARVMGKLAVRQVQRRLAKPVTPARPTAHRAPASPDGAGGSASATGSQPASGLNGSRDAGRGSVPSSPSRGPTGASAPRRAAESRLGSEVSGVTVSASPEKPPALPLADSLAIPGYDTLAASQVVLRLSSLRPDELDAIARYEVATRGRRTILHRIGQLRADR